MASHTHQGSPANVGPAVVLSLVEVVDDDESGGGITFEPVVKSEDVGGGEDGGFVWPVVTVDVPDACPVVESIDDGEDPWAVEDWDEDGLEDIGPGVELEGEVAGLELVAWDVVADALAGGDADEEIPVDTVAEDTAAGAGGVPPGKKKR